MEAAKSPYTKLLVRITLVAALAAVLLAVAAGLGPRISFWQQKRLAKGLVAELEGTPRAGYQVVLKQVSSLGNPAIEALVIAAASERADIALAARRVIEEEIATWKIRAEQDEHYSLAEPTGLLAAALAEHVDEFGAFGQQWATRLTLDIVDLAESFSVEAAVPVLADCSAVLNAVPALGPRMLTPEKLPRPVEPEQIAAALPELQLPALPYEQPTSRWPRGPKGAVPMIPSEIVENPQTTQELLRSTALPRSSSWVPEWMTQPDQATVKPQPIETAKEAPAPAIAGDLIEVPSPEEQAVLVESLQSLETRELLAQLKESDPFKVAAIREVLGGRGIAADELGLAQRLFAEDSAERLKLIDDLKVLPARTARRWLRELLADKDAEVRLCALTALATTNDPELRSIARDIAIRDTDRRVAELASQIMRQVK